MENIDKIIDRLDSQQSKPYTYGSYVKKHYILKELQTILQSFNEEEKIEYAKYLENKLPNLLLKKDILDNYTLKKLLIISSGFSDISYYLPKIKDIILNLCSKNKNKYLKYFIVLYNFYENNDLDTYELYDYFCKRYLKSNRNNNIPFIYLYRLGYSINKYDKKYVLDFLVSQRPFKKDKYTIEWFINCNSELERYRILL